MGLTYKLEKGLKKVVKNVFSKIVQNRIKIIWNSKNFIFSPDFGHFRGWVGVLNQIWRIRDLFFFNPIPLGKGSKKKINYGKIPYRVLTPPPPRYGKKFLNFFLKLDHFLRTFCKKCIFTIENPKKLRKFFKK